MTMAAAACVAVATLPGDFAVAGTMLPVDCAVTAGMLPADCPVAAAPHAVTSAGAVACQNELDVEQKCADWEGEAHDAGAVVESSWDCQLRSHCVRQHVVCHSQGLLPLHDVEVEIHCQPDVALVALTLPAVYL